ncbi:MAG: hypothetical protein M3273_05400, partial [Actinomycetota bacterium]|nr:hypothetical protein [Actinomycetota bacterium]
LDDSVVNPRPMVGVDVDIHAQGPNDNLAFNTAGAEQDEFDSAQSDNSQAPQNHPTESGKRCSNDTPSGTQGVHAIGGGDDRKHVESVDETDDAGRFRYRLWSDAQGGTRMTAWADTTDDDRFCPNEKSGSGTVTWGTGDPAPPEEGPEPPPCPAASPTSPGSPTSPSPTPTPTPTPTSPTPSVSGSVSPTPTPSGTVTATPTPTPTPGTGTTGTTATPPPQSTREISLEASQSRKTFGKTFSLSGAVTSDNPACTDFVTVRIMRDVIGGSDNFTLFAQEQTDANGAYTADFRADRGANYVAQVLETTACDDGSSEAQPVLVRVRVFLKLSDSEVDRGDRVRLRVRTAPCPDTARDRVLLFRAIEGEFGKSGKRRSNGDCRATFTRRVRRPSVFQARWPKQDPEFLAGRSTSKAVRVNR